MELPTLLQGAKKETSSEHTPEPKDVEVIDKKEEKKEGGKGEGE